MIKEKVKRICEKCGRSLDEEKNFYTNRQGQRLNICKSCLTMHIDNFDPDTFLWILELVDVPYLPNIWEQIRDKAYAKNPNLTGQSVLGRYFSAMKLNQYKNYGYKDSQMAQADVDKRDEAQKQRQQAQAERVKEQFENGEISEAQYRTLVDSVEQQKHDAIINSQPQLDPVGADNMFNEKNFISEDELPNPAADLTMDEKKMLAVKWGRMYTANDWIELERLYQDMINSFDIQDADSKNTLMFICKTNLKMNQALDCGDIEGYQKLSRVYDSLRKSAKFTAAQNKDEKGDFIDSLGELVAYCEKEGHQIPKFEITTPHDIVDKVIMDLKDYNRSLIYEDATLGRQIEDYLKAMKNAAARKADIAQAKEEGYEVPQLTEEDTMAFKDFLKKESEETDAITQGGVEDELIDPA